MKFDFGENLKRLRKNKGFTQEETAEMLGTTKQSLSRWENNITAPDVFFLPALASFYNVSVDSLLGVEAERTEKIKDDYFTKNRDFHLVGDYLAAFEETQKIYSEFPNDKRIINNLMTDSYLMGLHDPDGKRAFYLGLSISTAERFMKLSGDMEEKCRCIRNIATCYKLQGNNEAAKEWMKKLPSIWSGIEHTLLAVLDGDEKSEAVKHSTEDIIHLLNRMLWAAGENTELSREERLFMYKKIPALYEVIFERGDYGFFDYYLSGVHLKIAELSEDKEEITQNLKRAYFLTSRFDTAKKNEYGSLLLKGLPIDPDEWSRSSKESRTGRLLRLIKSTEFFGVTGDELVKELQK